MDDLQLAWRALEAFPLLGEVKQVEPYGEGHINRTYLVTTDKTRYILQRMNQYVFPDSDALMDNICRVTDHLRKRGQGTLQVIYAKDGQPLHRIEGHAFRVYDFIEDSVTYQTASDLDAFRNVAYAFGAFQNALSDFDASCLSTPIQRFHDTPHRFETFLAALESDPKGRAAGCQEEIAFYLAQRDRLSLVVDGLSNGTIPLRVTHNDTKLNNILMDPITLQARAVVDLDTVMPGSMLYDFGDSIRFGASTAKEDEEDLSLVHFDIRLYEVYLEGYLAAVKDCITPREAELLWYSAYLLTTECGMRFLTDYLLGDVYFSTRYPEHNLVRCRTQMTLAREMWERQEEMLAISNRILYGDKA